MKVDKVLDEVRKQEEEFLKSTFLAPVYKGGRVRTSVANLTSVLQVKHAKPGWAIIKPTSLIEAKVVRRPSHGELLKYLTKLPRVSFILSARHDSTWFGFPSYTYHSIFGNLETLNLRQVNVVTILPGLQFDQVVTGHDGKHFWYLSPDYKRHPGVGDYLRKALKRRVPPKDIKFPSLTPQEKKVYRIALELEKEPIETLLEKAVSHAGGKFDSYSDRGDLYLVSFTVDGEKVGATIKKDLQVISAGFCLDGGDKDFDLASLVSVVRERQEQGRDDEDDW